DSLVHPVAVRTHEVGHPPTSRADDGGVDERVPKAGVTSPVVRQRNEQRIEHIQRIEMNAPVQTVSLSPVRGQNTRQLRQRSGKWLYFDLPEMDGLMASWPVISGIRVGANVMPAFTNKGFSL